MHYLTVAMAALGLVGVSGIYLRQARSAGTLSLIGALCLGLSYLLTAAFAFAEAAILPALAPHVPQFVDSFLGISTGSGGPIELPTLRASGAAPSGCTC